MLICLIYLKINYVNYKMRTLNILTKKLNYIDFSKRMYSTPTFHKEFSCKKNIKKKGPNNEVSKNYVTKSYFYMYASLPIKNYVEFKKKK